MSHSRFIFHPAVAKRSADEQPVQNGLAITPSDMDDLRKQGLAISAQLNSVVNDIKSNDFDFEVPLEFQRGVDMAEMFTARENVKSKLRTLRKKVIDGEITPVEPLAGERQNS